MRVSIFHRTATQEAASEAERAATKQAAVEARKVLDQQFDSLFDLMNATLETVKRKQEVESKTANGKDTGDER